jgi:hypothetical protein
MTTAIGKRLPAAAAAILTLALAGCQSGMTYGTGTSPGMQTVQDLTGLATGMGGGSKEPIDYKPRPRLVPPPATAALPPPVDPNAPALAANWPVDPDLQRAALKADIASREEAGLPLPAFSLPPGATPTPLAASIDPNRPMTKEEIETVRKAFAAAKGTVAVDANGNPVRRYLTDPPNVYRVPDSEAAVALADMPKSKKKKFLWWNWE